MNHAEITVQFPRQMSYCLCSPPDSLQPKKGNCIFFKGLFELSNDEGINWKIKRRVYNSDLFPLPPSPPPMLPWRPENILTPAKRNALIIKQEVWEGNSSSHSGTRRNTGKKRKLGGVPTGSAGTKTTESGLLALFLSQICM